MGATRTDCPECGMMVTVFCDKHRSVRAWHTGTGTVSCDAVLLPEGRGYIEPEAVAS